jgi:hypothetical protein
VLDLPVGTVMEYKNNNGTFMLSSLYLSFLWFFVCGFSLRLGFLDCRGGYRWGWSLYGSLPYNFHGGLRWASNFVGCDGLFWGGTRAYVGSFERAGAGRLPFLSFIFALLLHPGNPVGFALGRVGSRRRVLLCCFFFFLFVVGRKRERGMYVRGRACASWRLFRSLNEGVRIC